MNAVPGDVIQIDPTHDEMFGGCFAIVDEVKAWGVSLCGVPIPSADHQVAYYRLPHGAYEVIGKAVWAQKRDTES